MSGAAGDIELLRARLAGDREQAAIAAARIFDDLTGTDDGHLVELRRAFVTRLVEEEFSPAKMREISELKENLRFGGHLGTPRPELGPA